jgi:hypothetical protein
MMTEIEFFSYEPNQAFKTALHERAFKLIAWIPPRKARKNARRPASKYGTLHWRWIVASSLPSAAGGVGSRHTYRRRENENAAGCDQHPAA